MSIQRVHWRAAGTHLFARVHDRAAEEGNGQPDAAEFRPRCHAADGDGRGDVLEASPQGRAAAASRIGTSCCGSGSRGCSRRQAVSAAGSARKRSLMVQKDLERADSLRDRRRHCRLPCRRPAHLYHANCCGNGASLPEAKELARHSDIKMTMRYTHIGIDDQARAVANLPAPKTASKTDASARSRERMPRCKCAAFPAALRVIRCHRMATDELTLDAKTLAASKGLVADRRQLSSAVKAEGMGFEPTTPCGAPDFESGRWPVRLPSEFPDSPRHWATIGDGQRQSHCTEEG